LIVPESWNLILGVCEAPKGGGLENYEPLINHSFTSPPLLGRLGGAFDNLELFWELVLILWIQYELYVETGHALS
jgi:hypothetical protein